MEEERSACKFLVGQLEGLRPLGRKRRGWKNNRKIDIREI
jgi:hypothetical protein